MTTTALGPSRPPAASGGRPASRERALAVVALHVVDYNFLQPQPGTSAGNHLRAPQVFLIHAGHGLCGEASTPRFFKAGACSFIQPTLNDPPG